MEVRNPGGAVVIVNETEVFSGATPAASAWTDLDLSAVVGTNPALVLLKIASPNALSYVSFRKKGDADEFWSAGAYAPASGRGKITPSIHETFWVPTDAAGVIQWRAENLSVATTTIDVMAYIK